MKNLTQLQLAVLGSLLSGEVSGRELREKLSTLGFKKSGPAFYQMMSRLEDGKMVKGHYDEKIVEGQRIKERRYKVTASGSRAWNDAAMMFGVLGLSGA